MLCLLRLLALLLVPVALGSPALASAQEVSLRGLGRFDGWRENALIGYGLVTGLAGSGDTRRSAVTRQALRNVLNRLGTTVTDDQISSRNVAVVMVIGTLPASANVGDRIDVTVSSIGDARSLAGGTLLMTPMLGPDQHPYALAQGALVAGGYSFESDLNQQQRNYPTTAMLQGGATVETAVNATILRSDGQLSFLLSDPSFGTAQRIAETVNNRFGFGSAIAKSADEVKIRYAGDPAQLTNFLAQIEALSVRPDRAPRVVVNERTGTIVAGGDVMISSVAISQGDIKVTIKAENIASQPNFYSGFASDVRSLIVTNTKLDVDDSVGDTVVSFPNTTVSDLVQGLSRARVNTRRMISILQAIKTAGALHADIIVQ
ncbi:flagellar basal body P-ring protein FlgI [Sphingomonas sp. QA11]|uniref:flagellar basal body P-ring protein FlgI n=1 Tax=Sphingomonas sp. QA11 TaxID=2950605 RepID=UPI00234B4091|nr:flagellar basal body P-ring protein FlgI [Sphingomonas sp. QA11]WCM27296.1 flagellar basal body P-ring protein FlgI [Sphingomonas sp. QA11]